MRFIEWRRSRQPTGFDPDDPAHRVAYEEFLQDRESKRAADRRRDEEQRAKEEERRAEEEREQQAKREMLWRYAVGARYVNCRFDSFVCSSEGMHQAVDICRNSATDLLKKTDKANLVLYGGVGSGKDHLAVAICRALLENGWNPVQDEKFDAGNWVTDDGLDLGPGRKFRVTTGAEIVMTCRDAMHKGNERSTIDAFVNPDLLVLSDPTPPSGDALTVFQSSVLAALVDARYRSALPTIVTINCRDRAQMDEMLTLPIADRLRDGAVTVACDWPSYRKTLSRREG